MKATLVYTLPEEQEEYKTAMKGGDYKLAVWDIRQELFRPYRKHGYPNETLQKLLDANPCISEFMGELEKQLYTILEEHGANE